MSDSKELEKAVRDDFESMKIYAVQKDTGNTVELRRIMIKEVTPDMLQMIPSLIRTGKIWILKGKWNTEKTFHGKRIGNRSIEKIIVEQSEKMPEVIKKADIHIEEMSDKDAVIVSKVSERLSTIFARNKPNHNPPLNPKKGPVREFVGETVKKPKGI